MRGRVSLGVAALAAFVGACLASDAGRPDYGSGLHRAPPPGPVSRALVWEPVWTYHTKGGAAKDASRAPDLDRVDLGFDKTLMVRRPSGAEDILDITTGRVLRTLGEPPDSPPEVRQIGNVLLDYRTDSQDSLDGLHHSGALSAYDLDSGSQLWEQRGTMSQTLYPGESESDESTAEGGVIVLTERGLVWHEGPFSTGQNLRTGATTWTHDRKGPRCRTGEASQQQAATRKHWLTLINCDGEETVLEATDPGTGHLAWRRNLGRLMEPEISVTPDVVAIGSREYRKTVRFFDDSGEQLAATKLHDPVRSSYLEDLVGRYRDTLYFYNDDALYALPVGSTIPSRQRTRLELPRMFGRGMMVGFSANEDLRGYSDLGRPTQSVVADIASRVEHVLPIPGGGRVVGAVKNLVITQREEHGQMLVSALRLRHRKSSSPALGGVPPTDWPDACALLSDRDLTDLGRKYVRLPVRASREVFGTRLPRVSACRFATPSADQNQLFEIRVQWVAEDAAAARHLAEGDMPWRHPAASVRRLGSGTYLCRDATSGEQDADSAVIKVEGRRIVMVTGRNADLLEHAAALLGGRSIQAALTLDRHAR